MHLLWNRLTARRGRRGTLSRELQDGNELLQSDFEDLGNFHKRLDVRNGLQNLSQRRPSFAHHPNIAVLSRYAPAPPDILTNPTGLPDNSLVSLAVMLAYLTKLTSLTHLGRKTAIFRL